jgi:hypothetical protein
MIKDFKMQFAGLIPLDVNVEIVHKDREGNVKPIFQENKLGNWLIKKGWLSPLWINGWLNNLSFLFGYWSASKFNSNLITDAGRAAAASRINGSGGEALFDKIGQGVGVAAAANSDTALGTEKDGANTTTTTHAISAATASRVTTTVTNDTAQLVGTVSETATMAITESGLFNAATAGSLLARQTFSAVNVVNGDSLQFTWKIKAA